MGDISDYYMDIAMNQMAEEDAMRELDQQMAKDIIEDYTMGIAIWETREGEELMVVEMKDEHVKNCLNFLRPKKNKSNMTLAWIKIFKAECIKRKI